MQQLNLFTTPWCQRWQAGTHRWRHRSEGGFRSEAYIVAPIDESAAKTFVVTHHYSHTLPATRLRWGLFTREDEQLVGVAVLSVPVRERVLTAVFPGLEPYVESLELGRFVLLDAIPANAESWMLARVLDQAAHHGVRGVVSFSDPLPRTDAAGRVIMPGHVGTIYQASNALYTGRATPRSLIVLPDGTVLNDRARQKVRAGERGYQHVVRRLQLLGAPALRGDRTRWLHAALDIVGARRVQHPGNHRFAFRCGRDRREARAVAVLPNSQPYPKRET